MRWFVRYVVFGESLLVGVVFLLVGVNFCLLWWVGVCWVCCQKTFW